MKLKMFELVFIESWVFLTHIRSYLLIFVGILGVIDSILRNNGLLWAPFNEYWALRLAFMGFWSLHFENVYRGTPYNVLKIRPTITRTNNP